VGAGGHHRVGITEEIKGEDGEQRPKADGHPGQIFQHKRPNALPGQEGGNQQREHCRTRQTDEAQRGEHGFSRVFHATKVKILRATCNSAFSGQVKRVAKMECDKLKSKPTN
jgi:hypothetical protein